MSQCAPQVAPSTLASVVAVESGGNAFAIGVPKGAPVRQPTSAAEAVAVAKSLLARGANVDLGLSQINSSNLRWLGLSVQAAFDPCQNLAAAARLLTNNYRRAISLGHPTPLGAALSAYNTGSMQRGYRNGYVARVYRASGTRLLTGSAPAIVASLPTPPVTSIPPKRSLEIAEGLPAAAAASVVPVAIHLAAVTASPPAPPAWDVFARASTARIFSSNSKGSN